MLDWLGYEEINTEEFGPDCYGILGEDDYDENKCIGGVQPNYNRLVQLNKTTANERDVEHVVIDLEKLDDNALLLEDIELRIGSEPWWFNQFWRKLLVIILPLWAFTYIFFAGYGYCNFKGYAKKKLGKIFCIKDKWWIYPEYFNHTKDLWYFFRRDHSHIFVLLFANTIVLPPILSCFGIDWLDMKAYWGLE